MLLPIIFFLGCYSCGMDTSSQKKGSVVHVNQTSPLSSSQHIQSLKQQIESYLEDKKADVGIAIMGPEPSDTLYIHGNKMYPMLSTFKFPIAIVVGHAVEKGRLTWDQKVFIDKNKMLPKTHSPFIEQHPQANVEITIEECLYWMLVHSDNNITDVLVNLLGGMTTIQDFFNTNDFVFKNNEHDMHQSWESQFVNTARPSAMTHMLYQFMNRTYVQKEAQEIIYKYMKASETGLKRLPALLPSGTEVAQRSGTSFTNDKGVTGAVNNVGIIKLESGKYVYISVFVHNTTETFEAAEMMIAEVARLTWEHFN